MPKQTSNPGEKPAEEEAEKVPPEGAPGAKETVSADDVLKLAKEPPKKEVVTAEQVLMGVPRTAELGPAQHAARQLAWGVGVTIFLVIAFLVLYVVKSTPIPPPSTAQTTEIDSFKALAGSAMTQAMTFFDTVVVKALLPVFTSILGYLFGTRGETTPSS